MKDKSIDDLSFVGLMRLLWTGKRWIVGGALLFGGLAAALAFSIAPMYRSEAVLVPVRDDESVGSLAALQGQLGNLVSMVGGGAAGADSGANESLAVLESRDFIEQFIADEQLLPVLFSDLWDASAGRWQVKSDEEIPTFQDGSIFFTDTLYRVRQDRQTGLITLSVDWYEPATAVHWVELLVSRLNARMRARTIAETEKSMIYLSAELGKANEIELRQAINRLIEAQAKQAMFARIRDDFALRVVSRPLPSDLDRPVRPKRFLMVFLGAFGGLLLGISVVLVRSRSRKPVAT